MSNVAAGKDTDDDGETLNNVEKVLNKLGIALRNSKKEWRSFEDVLDEVAAKWKDFADTERSQIATAIAGTRQQETFAAMMSNWKEVERLTQVAENSTGSATRKMAIYLDSVEAKTNNLKAAWEKLVLSFNQDDSYKQFLDVITNFLDKLSYVDWDTVIKVIGAFSALFGAAKMATWITKGIAAIKAAETGIAAMAAGLSAFAPILIVILGLVTAIAIAQDSINNNYDKKIDDLDKHIQSLQKEKAALDEDKKSVQALYNEYSNLEAKQKLIGLNADEKQRMADITKELVEQYGFEYDSVNSLTGEYNLATDALTKYTEAMEAQQKQLDASERKDRIKKVAEANKQYMASFGFKQAGEELKAWGLWESLGHELVAYKDAFAGNGTGGFFERYDQSLRKQLVEDGKVAKEEIKKINNETVEYMMDVMDTSINNSGLSNRFSNLFKNQLKIGLQDISVLDLDTEEEVEKFVSSYEKILGDLGTKQAESKVDKVLTEIEKKMADTSVAMNLQDYKRYNQALEEQAGISASLLSNIIDNDKAVKIAIQSLQESLSNTGSYFALISDSIEDKKIRNKFDNIANGIININDQLADGRINIQQYFNTMKSQIDSIDLSHIENSFGNIGNYLATMGQVTNVGGGQLQSIITDMQQGKKLNNTGVDDIKTISNLFGTVYKNMLSTAKDENGNWKSFRYQSGIDKNGNAIYSQDTLEKYFNDTVATDKEVIKTLQQKQNAVKDELTGAKETLQNLKNIKNGEKVTSTQGVNRVESQNGMYKRQLQPTAMESLGLNNGKNNIQKINEEIVKQEKKIVELEKQEKSYEKEIANEQNRKNKGMSSYLKDLSEGVDYLDSFDWDSLDKASDTIFQGFIDGALDATSTINNVKKEYKDAALEMSNAFIQMTSDSNKAFTSLGEETRKQMTAISEETLQQIGLTSNASAEQIANAMLSSNANFNAVVGAMNKNAQQALQQVLEGAGGMLEALGTAIEQFTGEIDISIGGIRFNGLKSFMSWDGAELFSSSDTVKSKISFSGSGIDTKSLGSAIKTAGQSLKENAGTLAAQWNPIQPDAIKKNKPSGNGSTGGKTGGKKSGSGGGNSYSPADAAQDKKEILSDIEQYEADIAADLYDQTEELINHYDLQKNRLATLKEELDYYEGIYDSTENTTKWLETQNKLLANQSKSVAAMQQSNAKIEKQREKIYKENKQYNIKSWFDSEGNETLAYGDLINKRERKIESIQESAAAKMRKQYNKIKNSTDKDTIQKAKDKIKLIKEEAETKAKTVEDEIKKIEQIYDDVDKLNSAWRDNKEAIRDALAEMADRVKDIRDKLVDQLLDTLQRAVDRENTSLENSATRIEQLVSVQEQYNNILNDLYDTQADLDSELQSNLDSYEYLDEQMRQLMFNEEDYKVLSNTISGIQKDITDIWADHYNQISNLTEDEMYKAEYITSETERQLEAKQKEYELAKAELDVAKAQTNLQNVQNERNTRMLINGQWVWTANPDAVKEARKNLADAQSAKNRVVREQSQQAVIDSMNKLIDADNRQMDKNNFLLEKVEKAIEDQTTEVKTVQEALNNIKTENLPAMSTLIEGAFGKDGKSGYIQELLTNINESSQTLISSLANPTIDEAINSLKGGKLSKKNFESLVDKLGYSFDPTTGKITTQTGSFNASYQGFVKESLKDKQTKTDKETGKQVTDNGKNKKSTNTNKNADKKKDNGNGFPKTGKVTTQSANLMLRSKPSTSGKILKRMPKGSKVEVLAETNKNWAQIKYNGKTGYASRQYLTYDQGGLAYGDGVFLKDVNVPERVLSPRQTKAFENLVDNLTVNPVLQALTKSVKGSSNFNQLAPVGMGDKNYYFSNFTVQADNISEFINSLEGMIPISKK